MKVEIKGEAGITATIIQDSMSTHGVRITTYELEYPRFIHAELMTHRMFSRNAASSRAIPVEKMHQHILDNPATPVVWQKNQAGMQSKENLVGAELDHAKSVWAKAVKTLVEVSKELMAAGLHKQWANRPTEAVQMMKTVVTMTERENWYWLRDHEDAQPEIHELASCMLKADLESVPMKLEYGDWHVPYVYRSRPILNKGMVYSDGVGNVLTLDEAKMISASCCAQVSYRKSDDTLDKAKMVFSRLINSEPVHASPVEHQATPMRFDKQVFGSTSSWEDGITHMRRDCSYWSGNFRGWIQYRQLIPNNVKE